MKLSSPHHFFPSSATVAACLLLLLTGASLHPEEAAIVSGHSPLGSTPQQIAALYGPVLRHNARVRRHQILEGGTVIDGDLYSHNGLVIRVVFYAGVALLLEYTRVDGALTVQDANLLLAANADASTWEPGKENTEASRFYRRSDNKAIAHYATEYDGSLLIAAESIGGNFLKDRVLDGH